MITKFKTYAVVLLAGFVLGGLYGALWERCMVSPVSSTLPATTEELENARMSMHQPPPPVRAQDATKIALLDA